MNILITGASGSGTTTFGKYIAEKNDWTHIDADDYYWLPIEPRFTKKRESLDRLNLILAEIKKHKSNIVSGSVMQWGKEIEDLFDLIIFLYVETPVRIERLKERELIREGYIKPDFIKWASEYDTGPEYGRSLAKHKEWLSKRITKILKIEGNFSTEERYKILKNKMGTFN